MCEAIEQAHFLGVGGSRHSSVCSCDRDVVRSERYGLQSHVPALVPTPTSTLPILTVARFVSC